jgi:Redoxin
MDAQVVPIYGHRAAHPWDRYKYDQSPTAGNPYTDGTGLAFYAYAADHPKKPPPGQTTRPGGASKFETAYPTDQATAKQSGYEREKDPPETPWKGAWAYAYDDPYGTVAIYEHGASSARYFYSQSEPASGGWGRGGNPIFYAYAAHKPGTVAVYEHESPQGKGPDRYMLDQRTDAHDGWMASGVPAFYALPVGYRVGDKAADTTGLDQNNKSVTLSSLFDGKSWVWIDICAAWCGPCRMMASKAKAFVANVNQEGLPFKLFSVLANGNGGTASTQNDAAAWAMKYGLTSVVHCNAAPGSVLLDLPFRYALANGAPEAAYPTSVLVDEKGDVRAYHLGMDLDGFQDLVALNSVRTLTGGPWNV